MAETPIKPATQSKLGIAGNTQALALVDQARLIARTILDGFERHFSIFQHITAGARQRFEEADWLGAQMAARKRINLYDQRTLETLNKLRDEMAITNLDKPLWAEVKVQYVDLLIEHRQPELAESYFNSVFCKLFHRRYFNNSNIFVRSSVSVEYLQADRPIYKSYYPGTRGLRETIELIFEDAQFKLPFEDLCRDVRQVMRHLNRTLPKNKRSISLNYQIDVLSAVFFRNKAAYLIGRVINGYETTPFIVPILNNENGGLFVDALLVDIQDVYTVFGFSRAYFMVETEVPSATVEFLMQILPTKSKADLYSAIGFHKQGKTAFYRDFLHHLRHSTDKIIEAPGIRGMVMMVFTLPSYPYVFKIIKDSFDPPKNFARSDVVAKYQLVKQHDRIGRLADTLEYSDVALPKDRFNDELLQSLIETCSKAVSLEGGMVILKHVYIEHRMIPLNLILEHASDEDELLYFARGYGDAIREMAAANIFPGDMLLKNFGVTRHRRVVFYDYDEIRYLTECRIRQLPPARYPDEELISEPWFSVGDDDIFPEEFKKYFLSNQGLAKHFVDHHSDLMTVKFWREMQQSVRAGVLNDVFPYRRSIRFPRGGSEASQDYAA